LGFIWVPEGREELLWGAEVAMVAVYDKVGQKREELSPPCFRELFVPFQGQPGGEEGA